MEDNFWALAIYEKDAVILSQNDVATAHVALHKLIVALPSGLEVQKADSMVETVGLKHLREGHTQFDPRCTVCIEA